MMPSSKLSVVKKFITEALINNIYPETIFWVNKESRLVCTYLLNQHNKDKAKETSRMLKDYAKLRPRKTEQDSGSDRQRFIQALKHSPYIEILKQSTRDTKFIYLKESNESAPGSVDCEQAAGPSGMNETDASVPQVTGVENFESPPTPLLHESEMEYGGTPSQVPPPSSPLPDLDKETMDFQLIGSENLVSDDINPPVVCHSEDHFSKVFSPDWSPDLSDIATLEESVGENENGFFPSDYDPTMDFLEALGSPRNAIEQELYCPSDNNCNSVGQIADVQRIRQSGNRILPLGSLDSDGMDRTDCSVMILLENKE